MKKTQTKKVEKKSQTKVETPETKLAEISKEVIKVEKKASVLVVKTKKDYDNASVFLIEVLKPRINRVNTLLKFFTDPFMEARRVALENKQKVELLFAPQISRFNQVETVVKRLMGNWQLEEDRKAKVEEDRLAKLREKQNERREENDKPLNLTPLPTVARQEATIRTEEGKATAKKVWKFEILNIDKLDGDVMREVFNVAFEKGIVESVIRKMVNSGVRELSGVRIYEDYDIGVSAKKTSF